MKAAMEVA